MTTLRCTECGEMVTMSNGQPVHAGTHQKIYHVYRTSQGVIAKVLMDNTAYHLTHLVHHSSDGFEFGYGGSGPSDLARSIVGDFLHNNEPPPQIYQEFKWAFVADQKGPEFMITDDEIDTWMSENSMYETLR